MKTAPKSVRDSGSLFSQPLNGPSHSSIQPLQTKQNPTPDTRSHKSAFISFTPCGQRFQSMLVSQEPFPRNVTPKHETVQTDRRERQKCRRCSRIPPCCRPICKHMYRAHARARTHMTSHDRPKIRLRPRVVRLGVLLDVCCGRGATQKHKVRSMRVALAMR